MTSMTANEPDVLPPTSVRMLARIIASAAANRFDGGGGTHNRVSYANSSVDETVNLVTSAGSGGIGSLANGDTYANIQDVTGGSGNDTFYGNAAANRFDGGGGLHNRVNYSSSTVSETVNLFNGKDLTGWEALGKNQWIVKNGVLTSPHSGANLISTQKFTDFKLHVEFRYQQGSNSGVYLRGRYETQIEDSPKDKHPDSHLFSGIYGFLSPIEINALGPDQWQRYDITLVGRTITVVANGKTVICNQEIPGITGGALDSDEGAPGPIYIQGDHGPIEFRKIVITPAQ